MLFNSLRARRPGREPIAYICDFSRYEKSSSMKRPTLKVIDFDSVVQNTKSSKSIILMSAFSNILLQSRSKVWMRAHERTFKPPRLKSQICLIGGNGFVCSFPRACLKNHSCNLHTLICGIFCPHSVDVARYAALIRAKSPTNYDAHLAESIFQTRSSELNRKLCYNGGVLIYLQEECYNEKTI